MLFSCPPLCPLLGSRLEHCATSRKVAVSIIDEVIEFLNWPNLSIRTMALWRTQPVAEVSTRTLPGSKRHGRRVRVTISPPTVSRLTGKYESLDVLQPSGSPRPVKGTALPFCVGSRRDVNWMKTTSPSDCYHFAVMSEQLNTCRTLSERQLKSEAQISPDVCFPF
jgi:hypothetical protein